MTVVAPGTLVSLRLRRLTVAAVACFVLTLGGCSDYLAQREMDAMLASWVGSADLERADSMNMVAALAYVDPSSIENDSPLHQALSGKTTIRAQGEEFSQTGIREGRYVYRRRDGRMSVIITKEPDDASDAWLVFISRLEPAD